VDAASAAGNDQYGVWSDTSNTTPTQPVSHLTLSNTCMSGDKYAADYLKNLGTDITIKNNKVTGCGPE
jgi:hypothetical protein